MWTSGPSDRKFPDMPVKASSPPPADLAAYPLSLRLAHAGPAIQAIVRQAEVTITPSRVYLFGSRASGLHRPTSDIDLAFLVGNRSRFGEFAAWVDEESPTLLDVDLVDLDRCDARLRQAILGEGVLVYDRT